jgi:hypothetical protein
LLLVVDITRGLEDLVCVGHNIQFEWYLLQDEEIPFLKQLLRTARDENRLIL